MSENEKLREALDDIEPCPACGALPCDWVNNPHIDEALSTPPSEADADDVERKRIADIIDRRVSSPPSYGDKSLEAAHRVDQLRAADEILSAIQSRDAALREAIEKVRDGYRSQMKFCDIEALGYFREFVRRIDAALQMGGENHG